MKLKILNIIFFFGLIFLELSAQGLSDTVIHINEVSVVSSEPLNNKAIHIERIDSLVIQRSVFKDLAGLLSDHSSVFIKTAGEGALATASFRGTSASHTNVEWNGIQINNPMSGQMDLSLVPVCFIDRIELLAGGNSLLSGTGALGGTVSLSSHPDWHHGLNSLVTQSLGSFGRNQTLVSLGGGSGLFQGKIKFFHEQSDNDYEYVNNANGLWNKEKLENSSYRKNGLLTEIFFRTKDSQVFSLSSWIQSVNRNLPSIMSYQGAERREKQDDEQLRTSFSWKKYGGKLNSELISGISYTKLDYSRYDETDLGKMPIYDSESYTVSSYNRHILEWETGTRSMLRSQLNFNYHKVQNKDQLDFAGYKGSRKETGLSVSYHMQLNSSLSFFALLRNELIDTELSPLIPSLGVEWEAPGKDDLRIKYNITRNFHQPGLNDLYWIPGGNPDLLPEEGISSDMTAAYSLNRGIFFAESHLSVFVSQINNWILWNPGDWSAENVREVFSRGAELKLKTKVKTNLSTFGFQLNYAYTRTSNMKPQNRLDQSQNKQLIYIPVHQLNLGLNYSFVNFSLYYDFLYTGERFTTSSNEITRHSLPAYSIHNCSLENDFKINDFSAAVGFSVNNLLNKKFQSVLWRPRPGRNYMVSFKIDF